MRIAFHLLKIFIICFAIAGVISIWRAFNSDIHTAHNLNFKIAADLAVIENALRRFQDDVGRLPSDNEGLAILTYDKSQKPYPNGYASTGYLGVLPLDPWGNQYMYHQSATSKDTYFICSGTSQHTIRFHYCKLMEDR